MIDNESVGITRERINQIPDTWNQPFTPNDIPSVASILEEVNQDPNLENKGEISKAKANKDYIGLTDDELAIRIPEFINSCLLEMTQYEEVSRQPAEERLRKLREVAPTVTRIIDLAAPGDYYHLVKEDRFKGDPPMRGADRVRSDQAAILGIVLAGIKENWPEEDLLLFLNQHVLTTDNPQLNGLREKAKQALQNSGIRLVYAGREDEVQAIKTVLNQKNIFIPKECVDFIGPEGIDNTIDQTRRIKEYLHDNLRPGDSFIEPLNIQGIRSMRMANKYGMVPQDTNAFVYAMPTATGETALGYRRREIRGAVFYSLTDQATFAPVVHKVI